MHLLSFCEGNNLYIVSSLFTRSFCNIQSAVLEVYFASRKSRATFLDIRASREADESSDYCLVTSNLRIETA